jgi:hypothetical protein
LRRKIERIAGESQAGELPRQERPGESGQASGQSLPQNVRSQSGEVAVFSQGIEIPVGPFDADVSMARMRIRCEKPLVVIDGTRGETFSYDESQFRGGYVFSLADGSALELLKRGVRMSGFPVTSMVIQRPVGFVYDFTAQITDYSKELVSEDYKIGDLIYSCNKVLFMVADIGADSVHAVYVIDYNSFL